MCVYVCVEIALSLSVGLCAGRLISLVTRQRGVLFE